MAEASSAVDRPTKKQISSDERDDALLTAIEEREGGALGREYDPMAQDRATAINYYLGAPFGNEIEGRSQVVSKDVFDTIEWVKPALLRIFAGGDQVAEFPPQAEDDIEGAEQESDYINYILQRKNNWFSLCNEWFTDALLTRNAYVLAYWDEHEEPTLERYRGLTEDQLVLIAMDQSVEIIAHQSYQAPMPLPAPMALNAIQQGLMQGYPQITLHDVDIRRIKNYGCVKLECLPPERCMVAGDAKRVSLRDAAFFEYWEYKTLSELRADGFDVADDISDSGGIERGLVDQVRDLTQNTILYDQEMSSDPSMRKVKARMVWIRNDYDGDGIAELRYVVAVGRNILVNQEATNIPVATIVPYPMPHRHIGLSLFDAISDLQLIKSAMQRQVIDNQYLANNGRTAVDKNSVNLDDMMVSRPGGVIRVNGQPQAAIMPFVHPDTSAGAIAVLQYFDGIREDRGGVSKPFAGADLEAINAQPGTIAQLTSAASQKIEQIARVLAEGVRELFLLVHELTLSNATAEDKVQLRNKWVTVDPRQWRKRTDMNLMVGLGVGNRQQHMMAIAALLGLQEKALSVGLTSPSKIYNGLAEYVKALGFASCKQFFDEPDPGEPFQPQPPYQVQVAQMNNEAKIHIENMKQHGDLMLASIKEEGNNSRAYFETMIDAQNKSQDRFIRAVSEATDRMQEMRLAAIDQGAKATGEAQRVKEEQAKLEKMAMNDSLSKASTSADEANKRVKELVSELERMKKQKPEDKPKKFRITGPSGRVYNVEAA
jgi:hypothetical protein